MTEEAVEAIKAALLPLVAGASWCQTNDEIAETFARAAIAAMPRDSRNEVIEECARVAERCASDYDIEAFTTLPLKTIENVKWRARAVRAVANDIRALSHPADGRPLHDDGWRDIATAPKDGSWVMLYRPPEDHSPGRMYVATWESLSYNWPRTWAYGSNDGEHSFRSGVGEATHWRPLPAPPVRTEGSEE